MPFTAIYSYALGAHKTIKRRHKELAFSTGSDTLQSHKGNENISANKPSRFISNQLRGVRDRLIIDSNRGACTLPYRRYQKCPNYVSIQPYGFQDVPVESNKLVAFRPNRFAQNFYLSLTVSTMHMEGMKSNH